MKGKKKMKNRWWATNVDDDISELIVSLTSKLNGKEVKRNWTDDLALNYENIDTDMENIPTILAFWAAVLAEARKERGIIQMKMDIRKSKVLEGLRDTIPDGVKLTVADKDNIVCVDGKYMQLRKDAINLDATVSKLFGIVDAIKIKADNLRSFSAMKRAELHNT